MSVMPQALSVRRSSPRSGLTSIIASTVVEGNVFISFSSCPESGFLPLPVS